ncbi:hypothetical protein CYMTET_8026 [Cymbomonas tetramitiformis]|uniref:Right handed beta helix domain-containing protein n=1 Tax=Cymbomonas tetramitiformis TaxID=36881 RepID=A0AAE0GTV3_9CHLO|nr:hypothetical protein CYMTET_8026 [Cymbomonas tetramitiformis]
MVGFGAVLCCDPLAVGNENVSNIILMVDLRLQHPLGKLVINRIVNVIGDCGHSVCELQGGELGPLFTVRGPDGILAISKLAFTNFKSQGHASVVMNGEADIDTFREEAGAVMISDCSFSHNHGYYGVIYTMGDVIIRDSIMTANTAEYGGVLHVRYVMAENSEDDDGPSISISGSNVEGNAAVEGGGVLYCGCNSVDCTRGSPEISVSGSNLKNNLAKDLLRSSEITTGTDGGVVRVSQMAARISINDSNMENNTAHGEGGVVYSDAKNLVLYITESQMADNSADANGGVAAVDRDSGVFITASVMFRNRAQVSGGVIYSPSRLYGFDGFSYIVHSAMTLNSALQGGVVFLGSDSSMRIVECNMTLNSAQLNGGVVDATSAANLTIRGGLIEQNSAQGNGGVVNANSNSRVNLEVVVAAENNAGQAGGVLFCSLDSHVIITESTIVRNSAESGGVLRASFSSYVEIRGSGLRQNRATFDGGVAYAATQVQINISDCAMTDNEAERSGGALRIGSSTTHMTNVTAASNLALSGGAVCMVAGSHLQISHGRFEGNLATLEGGGISADNSTVHVMWQSRITSNAANQNGGGIALLPGSKLEMENATVAHNSAVEGGGLWVDQSAHAYVTSSELSGNVAYQEAFAESGMGGAVAAAAEITALLLDDCQLAGNEAHLGAGIFLHTLGQVSTVWLSNLHFDQNRAFVGPNVMWEYAVTAAIPECVNCTRTSTADALLSSTAVRYAVMQSGLEVGGTLWAESTVAINPPLSYVAVDFYGNITGLSLKVAGNTTQEPTVVAVAVANTSSLKGNTIGAYKYPDGAEFEALSMVGPPGGTFNLSLQPQTADWGDASVTVALAPCEAGTQYIEQGQVCERCATGLLKFDNSTEPCISTDCSAVDGVACHGGAEYTVEDGYWLAAESTRKCVDAGADSVACMFDRVYLCDFSGACDSGEDRSNTGGEPTIAQALMCAEGYRSDTVLCSVCQPGYQYAAANGSCTRCPESTLHGLLLAAAAFALTLCIGAAFYVAYPNTEAGREVGKDTIFSSKRKSQILQHHLKLRKRTRASGLLSTLLNHMQVMSQHILIFPIEVFPKFYYNFAVVFGAFNVSLVRWLGLQCLVAGTVSGRSFDDSVGVGLFYFNFLIIAAMPYVILLPVVVKLVLMSRRRQPACQRNTEGTLSPALDRPQEDPPGAKLQGAGAMVSTYSFVINPLAAEEAPKMEGASVENPLAAEEAPKMEGVSVENPLASEEAPKMEGAMVATAAEQQRCKKDSALVTPAIEEPSGEMDAAAVEAREGRVQSSEVRMATAVTIASDERNGGVIMAAAHKAEKRDEEVGMMMADQVAEEQNDAGGTSAVSTGMVEEQNVEVGMAAVSKTKEEDKKDMAAAAPAAEDQDQRNGLHMAAVEARAEGLNGGEVDTAAAVMVVNAAQEQSSETSTAVMESPAEGKSSEMDTMEMATTAQEPGSEADNPAVDGAEPDEHVDYFAAYSTFAIFFLIYVHPMVSTACFQVFQCDGIHFEKETVQYWLHADRSAECFTPEWFVFMSISIAVIFTFSLGLPVGLIVSVRYFHAQKKVTLLQEGGKKVPLFIEASQIHVSDDRRTYKVPHPTTGALIEVEPVFKDSAKGDGLDQLQSKLYEKEEVFVYAAPYIMPFKEEYFYFLGFTILIRLMQTSVVVLVRMENSVDMSKYMRTTFKLYVPLDFQG